MKEALLFIFGLVFSSQNYKGTLVHELDVAVPATDAWGVYGTHKLYDISLTLIPGEKVFINGDGGVGTTILVIFPPGYKGPGTYQKEKVVMFNNERRMLELILTEGGMLNYGFTTYSVRYEIVEKTIDSCTIKSSIEYEIDEEHADNIAYANTGHVAALAEAVAKYLLEKKTHIDQDDLMSAIL